MPSTKVTAALFGLCAAVSTHVVAQQAVLPGELFRGPVLEIRAPASSGWYLLRSGGRETSFISRDQGSGSTYVAEVYFVPLQRNSDAEIMGFAKMRMQARAPAPRYITIASNFEATSERPYPCVRFRGTIRDTKAMTPQGTASLPIYVRSLVCMHPRQTDLLLDIGFSQRGGIVDSNLDARAESFMSGVQVPQGQ